MPNRGGKGRGLDLRANGCHCHRHTPRSLTVIAMTLLLSQYEDQKLRSLGEPGRSEGGEVKGNHMVLNSNRLLSQGQADSREGWRLGQTDACKAHLKSQLLLISI